MCKYARLFERTLLWTIITWAHPCLVTRFVRCQRAPSFLTVFHSQPPLQSLVDPWLTRTALRAENGDFEEVSKPVADVVQDYKVIVQGANDITHWTVSKGSVDLIHRGGWGYGQSGDYFVDLNGYGPGAIEQVRATPNSGG